MFGKLFFAIAGRAKIEQKSYNRIYTLLLLRTKVFIPKR